MNKIRFVSIFFRLLFQVVFVALVAIQVIGWFYAPLRGVFINVIPNSYQAFLPESLDLNTRIAGFFISMLPTLIKLCVVYFLIKLFRLYERLEFFSPNNVRYIRNTGYSLLLLQAINPISEFLLGFVLTSGNPPGMRFARLSITEWNVGLILTALIVILISWIMTEGCKLHEEQQLII